MRVKAYSAPTVREAHNLIREDLGDDAIILGTREDGATVVVTAAVENDLAEETLTEQVAASDETAVAPDEADLPADAEALIRTLAYHGVPTNLAERLYREAAGLAVDGLPVGLAAALDTRFYFEPMPAAPRRPLMLVGAPGAGKTVTVAKLAARAMMGGLKVNVISTDTARAGGVDQLARFIDLLKLDLISVERPTELARAVAPGAEHGSVIIDTAGVNPYDVDAMKALGDLVQAAQAEPILVMPAGGDAAESADVARRFAKLGARRLLVTRLDVARRFGSVLAAADAANLSFSDASVTPFVGQGLHPLNPVSLARLLLRDPEQPHIDTEFDRASS